MQVPIIEKRAGMKFERIGAPQPADMARIAAERSLSLLAEVDPAVVEHFRWGWWLGVWGVSTQQALRMQAGRAEVGLQCERQHTSADDEASALAAFVLGLPHAQREQSQE